ncbi:TPA: DUF551 domain-containing protein [Escherichia coli]|nr:DUF551 domain-containing protein [Escherichia coli]HBE3751422.1 DUF551 domain-containing protein [Escherichia coli]HCW1524962.1 DUF551 domain-containing protein [Escherichia coli]
MTTITKDRLLTIKQWRETYGPGSNVVLPAEEAEELARIALASLEAEPVAYIFKHPAGKLFWALTDESNKEQPDVIPVYADSPAPVVPDEIDVNDVPRAVTYFKTHRDCYADGWNACRAAMLQSGNFRENKNSSTNNFREIAETSTNYPVIPSEVLSAILKVARIRADFDDFDGDRRGIGDCLDEAEQELIVTINKYASQLAAEPIATNDVREQQTAVPPIQADVAQAIENLKQKLVECNRYNYCADAVKGVEDACHAAMLQGSQPVSQTYNLPELIEGMEVSIDVSTCDADLGNRYFGTVTEALELDTAKNGYILLVQDAEPNFDVNGNSPVTPDGWISCSERMPDSKTAVLVAREFDRKGDWRMKWATYIPGHPDANDGWIIPGASWIPSHWMPLPEPPQEVNRG